MIWDRNLSFTPSNNISSITDNGTPKNYGYDALNQIIVAPEGTTTYDAVGNRINTPGVSVPYTVNALNQVTSDGVNSYGYSANGEMTAKVGPSGIWAYSYNPEGRLESVAKEGQTLASYTYDVFNRRIKKVVNATPTAAQSTTYYLYSSEGLMAEYTQTGQEIRSYGWKPNSTWGTDPVFLITQNLELQTPNPSVSFYVSDALGTPQRLINSSGDVVWSASYNTFGAANVTPDSTVENNLRFPGQYFDSESGWHYNFHRYYIPELGRYNRLDPIKDSINWYGYAGNNSVNIWDASGLKPTPEDWAEIGTNLIKNPDSNDIADYMNHHGAYYAYDLFSDGIKWQYRDNHPEFWRGTCDSPSDIGNRKEVGSRISERTSADRAIPETGPTIRKWVRYPTEVGATLVEGAMTRKWKKFGIYLTATYICVCDRQGLRWRIEETNTKEYLLNSSGTEKMFYARVR